MDVIEKIIRIFHGEGADIASEGTVGAGIAPAQYMSAP